MQPGLLAAGVPNAGAAEREAPAVTAMDEESFRVFYSQTAGPLRGYIRKVFPGSGLADDLLQEAYYRFLRRPPASNGPKENTAYLYRIATNLIYDYWRRSKRESEGLSELARDPEPPANADMRRDMSRLFRELKPRERALLWLAYVEGSKHQEIAAKLGVGERSVRVLLFRARKKLARLLREQELVTEATS